MNKCLPKNFQSNDDIRKIKIKKELTFNDMNCVSLL